MNVAGSLYVRRWTLLVRDTTRHLTNWMVKPDFEAICNSSNTTTMHSKILKKSSACFVCFWEDHHCNKLSHTVGHDWHLCTSKRNKTTFLNEHFHKFYFLYECVVYVYFWQNILILLAYDALVTVACQELIPFWGTVHDNNNDRDDEDNNDNDDDNGRWQQQW
jgi:hypothetical protein